MHFLFKARVSHITILTYLLKHLLHVRLSTLNRTIHYLSFQNIRSFGVDIISKAHYTQTMRTVRGERPISGFKHDLKVSLSRLYKKIEFVWRSLCLCHCYFLMRRSCLCHEVYTRIIIFPSEEHIYDQKCTFRVF